MAGMGGNAMTKAGPALIVRADGGPAIGGGHVMRCLALAQAWSETGGRVGFCAAALAPSLRQRLLREAFDVIDIEAAAASDGDGDATLAAAARFGASVAVVDGYHLPADYRRRLRQGGLTVAAIDDNGEIGTCVEDLVVNQNRHATPEMYRRRAGYTRLMLGTEYALLRKEFVGWSGSPRAFPAHPRKILITLGAADPQNATGRVIAAISPVVLPATRLSVVIGGSSPHAEAIAERAGRLPGCRVVHDPGEDMPSLMAAADLAICGGGSTMWEMAYMGTPFVPVIIADNQRLAVQAMASEGYPGIDAAALERDIASIVSSLGDTHRRQTLSRVGRRLVDGKGAKRVCEALRALAVA
jgi:UDP-2,4-diacetamido-2,4,6-trideoxy-beta-L-altropyranose hydrolase